MTLKFDEWPWKTIGHLFYTTSSFVYHFKSVGELKLKLQSTNAQFGSNRRFFVLCDLEIWWPWKTLGHFFCVASSFVHHFTAISQFRKLSYSLETPNFGQNRQFFSRLTLIFNGWPSKTKGHLFYATSSFVDHFVAIGEFKLQLQSGNAQSGSNSTIFRGVRPWNLMDDLAKQ